MRPEPATAESFTASRTQILHAAERELQLIECDLRDDNLRQSRTSLTLLSLMIAGVAFIVLIAVLTVSCFALPKPVPQPNAAHSSSTAPAPAQ